MKGLKFQLFPLSIFWGGILLCFVFLSCSKRGSSSLNEIISKYSNLSLEQKKIETILLSENSQFQRQSFAILSSKEKVDFLRVYLSTHIESFKNNSQKFTFIKNLIDEIDEEFVSPSGKVKVVKADYLAKELFTKDEFINVFYKISKDPSIFGNSLKESSIEGSDIALIDCHCGVNVV